MEKKGTKEWADKNINLFTGKCENGCLYCYAHAVIERFNQDPGWKCKENLLTKKYHKREYLTMYPSSHDIRMEDIFQHLQFLKRFLESGSQILIVSKPNPEVINRLCAQLINYKDQIEFRFTIGSVNNDALKFFEPEAPTYQDRWWALRSAYNYCYRTSLSIEPMLDQTPYAVFNSCQEFVTGDIWIGKMNNLKARMKLNGHLDKLNEAIRLTEWQNDDSQIMSIVKEFENSKFKDKVKWKDSIKEVIERNK